MKIVQKKQIFFAIMILVLYQCKGEISLSDFKDTLAIFNTKAAPYHAMSPLFGRTLASSELLKNIYLYGNQTDALCVLLKELFYVHPHTLDFNITRSEGNIAFYFNPKIVGQLIRALNDSSSQTIPNLESILTSIILNGLSETDMTRMLKHATWQKTKEEFDKNKKAELRHTLTQKAMSDFAAFTDLMDSRIEALKKKLALPQETTKQEVLKKGFADKESIKGHIDNAIGEVVAKMYKKQRVQAYSALIKPKAEYIAQQLIQSCAQDQQRYITFLTQHVLLVFLCLKGNNRDDLKIYFDQLDPGLFQYPFDPAKPGYAMQEYSDLKKNFENRSLFDEAFFNTLLNDSKQYEQFLFVGMAALLYERALPAPLPYIETSYKGHYFFNCGESALRSFLNIVFKKIGTDGYDEAVIDKIAKAPLKEFYQKHALSSLARTVQAHDDWNNIVSNLPHVKYVRALKNGKEGKLPDGATIADGYDAVYEINSGLANVITILRHLCNLPELEAYIANNTISTYNDSISIPIAVQSSNVRKPLSSKKGQRDPLKEKKNALLQALLTDLSSSEKLIADATIDDDGHSFSFTITVDNTKYTYEYNIQESKHAFLSELTSTVLLWRDTIWNNVLAQNIKTLESHIHTIVALQEAYAPESIIDKNKIITEQVTALGKSPLAFLLLGQYSLDGFGSQSLKDVVAQANRAVNECLYNYMVVLFKTGDTYEIEIGENLARIFLESIHDPSIKAYIDSLNTVLISDTEEPIMINEKFFLEFLTKNPTSESAWVDYATKLYTQENTRKQGLIMFRRLTKIENSAGVRQFLKLLYTEPLPIGPRTVQPMITDMGIIAIILNTIFEKQKYVFYSNELMILMDEVTKSATKLHDFGGTLIQKMYIHENNIDHTAIDTLIRKNLSTLAAQSVTNPNEQKLLLDSYLLLTNSQYTYLNHDFDILALHYLQMLIQHKVPYLVQIPILLNNLLIERYNPTLTELIKTLVMYLFLFSADMQEKPERSLISNISILLTSKDEGFKKSFYESFMQGAVNLSKQPNSVLTRSSASVMATTLVRLGVEGIKQNDVPTIITLLKRTAMTTDKETIQQVMVLFNVLKRNNIIAQNEYADIVTLLENSQTIQNSSALKELLQKIKQ
ncbi:MAG: hypothetical protein WCE21_02415 [Candidatus Babeliales bacterium]